MCGPVLLLRCLRVGYRRSDFSEVLYVALCRPTKVVHSHKQTMSSSYSYLDWVLSHWTHFTMSDLPVFTFVYFVFIFIICCIIVTRCGETAEIKAYSLDHYLLC